MSSPPIDSMSSAAKTPDVAAMLRNILSFINFDLSFAPGATTGSIVEDGVSDDTALIGMLIGFLVCSILGFLMLIDVALKMVYLAYIYICEFTPWAKAEELQRRERAVTLKETLVEKKARRVKMDVEIEASAQLVQIHREAMLSAERKLKELNFGKQLIEEREEHLALEEQELIRSATVNNEQDVY
ncbi:hypothetical protein LENED_006427 [Lentinula edodes]|uniref:Uncharacterized protein n=1 Tax=Lentinula edodes TaxID=5353 RepID=A0A1Q3EBQ3_LENED|nr:hypothetical protein GG344DRAFT_64757 [Lentinula edodes]GAW04622.1 hypothetical protein LENED_006427 [Lentinula edodes]